MSQNIGNRLRPFATGVVSAIVVSAVVWGLSYFAVGKGRVDSEAQATHLLDQVRVQLNRELDSILTIPETMAVFLSAAEEMEDTVFNTVASDILKKHPEIRSIVLAPDNIVSHVLPIESNEAVLGLHYYDVPEQAAAVDRAISTRKTVVAGPIELVQGGLGISSRTPVFLPVPKASGVAQAESDYWGIVSLTIDAEWLFSRLNINNNAKPEFRIAFRGADGLGENGEVFYGDPLVFASQPMVLKYILPGGGVWEMAAAPLAGWPGMRSGTSALLLLAYTLAIIIGFLSSRLMKNHEMAVRLSTHDMLTGLPNRMALMRCLERAVYRARRYKQYGALAMLDLDRFKPVNDAYGHAAGDQVLQQVAERLRTLLRNGDMVARLGGDEFALFLDQCSAPADLENFCTRLITEVKKPITIQENLQVCVTTCVGIAVLNSEYGSATDLLNRADKALYRSKRCVEGSFSIDQSTVEPSPLSRENMPRNTVSVYLA